MILKRGWKRFVSPRWEPERSGDSLTAGQPAGRAEPGNHGTVEADSSEPALRLGKPSRQIGTARYGPVRRVVLDPWLVDSFSQSRGPDWAWFLYRTPCFSSTVFTMARASLLMMFLPCATHAKA